MKAYNLFLFIAFNVLVLSSCKSTQHASSSKRQTDENSQIVKTALKYKGTKYKYGGTNKRGMDCSGLVYTTFKENNILLPRTSYEQSKFGKSVSFNHLTKGDLVFFRTSRKRKVNHVGIVTGRNKNGISFIHSSTSKGVVISSTNEAYWNKAYVSGGRINHKANRFKNLKIPAYQKTKTYTTKSGDTLYSIARKHNTTVAAIKKLNKLRSNDIKIGMELILF